MYMNPAGNMAKQEDMIKDSVCAPASLVALAGGVGDEEGIPHGRRRSRPMLGAGRTCRRRPLAIRYGGRDECADPRGGIARPPGS